MNKKLKILLTSVLILLSLYSIVLAQKPAIDNGIQWLEANQNADYSWDDTTALESTRFVDTSEVINTFNLLGINNIAYNNAISWLSVVISDNNYFSAIKILALSNTGIDISDDLEEL